MRTIDRRVWGRHRRGWFRRLLFEVRSLRRRENQACTCGGQIRIRIAFARQRDHGFRECLAYFVELSLSATRVAVRAATSGSARNLSAQTGANTAMTALSELVLANFSAVFRLMKPKPYESSNIPTTTPPAPVHREGFTTSQLIVMGRSSGLRKKKQSV